MHRTSPVPVNQVKFFATFATSCSFLFVVQLNAKFSFANRKPRNQVIDSKMMNVGSEVRLQAVDGNYQTGVFFQSNCGLFFGWLLLICWWLLHLDQLKRELRVHIYCRIYCWFLHNLMLVKTNVLTSNWLCTEPLQCQCSKWHFFAILAVHCSFFTDIWHIFHRNCTLQNIASFQCHYASVNIAVWHC